MTENNQSDIEEESEGPAEPSEDTAANEYKEKYFRLLAESENIRKRLQKEKQEMTAYAAERLMSDFLQPIDHMESALKYTEQMSDEIKHWGLGFQMILTQFKDVLATNGVLAFSSKGRPFDPHFHEAVEMEESDEAPGIVIEEFTKGYKLGDKIIRPARVKVSKAATKNEENEEVPL